MGTILQDMMGMLSRKKVVTPKTDDYITLARYAGAQERMKPHPKIQTELITMGALKTFVNVGGDDQQLSIAGQTLSLTNGGSVTLPAAATYSIGDFAHGGIVFWVDETGQHGLVCAKEDQSSGVRWYAGTYGVTQAKGDGVYSGKANTVIIIAAQVAIGDDGNTYAARMCNDLQITESGITYGDWYLSSKFELNLMYTNKATINTTASANGGSNFSTGTYWSSTEYDLNYAWYQSFDDGTQNAYNKNITVVDVRAVRAF